MIFGKNEIMNFENLEEDFMFYLEIDVDARKEKKPTIKEKEELFE